MGASTLKISPGLPLEQGGFLKEPKIAYHTYGRPDNPVVWVCHALTANSDVFDWWSGLFGPGCLFNPAEYYIVCANVLGSCYGTAGPLSLNPDTGQPYFHDFPLVSIRDMAVAHDALREHLGIQKIHLVIGGSLGGQQAMEWVISKPYLFENQALIATNAQHSPWGIAFNEAQRMAIEADSSWNKRYAAAGDAGMRAARAMALLSYRHYDAFRQTQSDETALFHGHKAASYQQYQGEKLSRRFNAFSYFRLSQAMDTHHIGRGRAAIETVLSEIKIPTLVVGIRSDVLFPVIEQQFLAKYLPNGTYQEIDSDYGHDGFLVETARLSVLLFDFLKSQEHLQEAEWTNNYSTG